MSEDYKHFEECFFCGREFQFGPGRYAGKWLSWFQLMVCETCYRGNWDGWAPHYENKLVPHLTKLGIDIPPRNEQGFMVRDPTVIVEIMPAPPKTN